MTLQEQLDAIDSRVKAATNLPWWRGSWRGRCRMAHTHSREVCNYEFTRDETEPCVSTSMENQELIGWGDSGPILRPNTAELIAHAPTDLARLTAALRVAVSGLNAIKYQTTFTPQVNEHIKLADEALAEISRIMEGEK